MQGGTYSEQQDSQSHGKCDQKEDFGETVDLQVNQSNLWEGAEGGEERGREVIKSKYILLSTTQPTLARGWEVLRELLVSLPV